MSRNEREAAARLLLADLDARAPWRAYAPADGLTTDDAYALQGEVARLREDRGERVIGYKIGCASLAIRDQLGISEPIFGRIFDTGCHPAGSRLVHADFAGLAIEGELAIRLSRDLDGDSLSDDAYDAAVGAIFPVLELHHYVLPAGGDPILALIASGGIHAGLVFPVEETTCQGRVPLVKRLDVTINDCLVGTTTEPWAMGGPAATLRWLTAHLGGWGARLRRGDLVLTGSALPLFPVEPGDRLVAEARPLGKSSADVV